MSMQPPSLPGAPTPPTIGDGTPSSCNHRTSQTCTSIASAQVKIQESCLHIGRDYAHPPSREAITALCLDSTPAQVMSTLTELLRASSPPQMEASWLNKLSCRLNSFLSEIRGRLTSSVLTSSSPPSCSEGQNSDTTPNVLITPTHNQKPFFTADLNLGTIVASTIEASPHRDGDSHSSLVPSAWLPIPIATRQTILTFASHLKFSAFSRLFYASFQRRLTRLHLLALTIIGPLIVTALLSLISALLEGS